MTKPTPGRTKTFPIFIVTILLGFILFVIPDVFFGVTKLNGGKIGVNLMIIGLFQFFAVSTLLYISLKKLGKNFGDIGLISRNWKTDTALGLLVGLSWTTLQFAWIIPATGGAAREDIRHMISMMDGTALGLFSYIVLGVVGGGITEELYNRGYFINVLKDTFHNPRIGLWVSALLSILFFALGHLPSDALGWFDILVPTLAYTLLFIFTGRLTASIVAHSSYNLTAILLTYYFYY